MIQIHAEGHSFSVYSTSGDEAVFRAGTGAEGSGVGMHPAYRDIRSLFSAPSKPGCHRPWYST